MAGAVGQGAGRVDGQRRAGDGQVAVGGGVEGLDDCACRVCQGNDSGAALDRLAEGDDDVADNVDARGRIGRAEGGDRRGGGVCRNRIGSPAPLEIDRLDVRQGKGGAAGAGKRCHAVGVRSADGVVGLAHLVDV